MLESKQSNAPKTQDSSTEMRGEIRQKWGKFSDQEISAIKDNNDLTAQVQSKYALDEAQAKRDVDAFARGRQL